MQPRKNGAITAGSRWELRPDENDRFAAAHGMPVKVSRNDNGWVYYTILPIAAVCRKRESDFRFLYQPEKGA